MLLYFFVFEPFKTINISSQITLLRKLNACCNLEIGINPRPDELANSVINGEYHLQIRGISKGTS